MEADLVVGPGITPATRESVRLRQFGAAALGTQALAAFDSHAGLVPQAPNWMQAVGMEWAYRLSREPKRRYATYNPRFVSGFARQWVGRR